MHGQVIENVGQAQAKQKKVYVSRKEKQLFVGSLKVKLMSR